jgi:hypothetical protein
MTTSEAISAVVRVLGPHIGETMARSAAEAHCQKLGLDAAGPIGPHQLDALLAKLSGGLNIFLGRDRSRAAIDEVRRALGATGGTH